MQPFCNIVCLTVCRIPQYLSFTLYWNVIQIATVPRWVALSLAPVSPSVSLSVRYATPVHPIVSKQKAAKTSNLADPGEE